MKWWWMLALLALAGCAEEEEAPPEVKCELAVEGEESCNHDEKVGRCCHGSTPGMLDICTAYKTVPGACSWMVDEAWENGTPLLDHPCRAVIGQCKNSWYVPEE